MERCKEKGHKGILFAHTFEALGLPNLHDERWVPILDAAQSLELPVNFHIGFNAGASDETADIFADQLHMPRRDTVEQTALAFMSNARAITMLIVHGVCERFPRLKFVPVESGFGWIPFLLQGLDWQWRNNAMRTEHPGWLLPSEYFRRQIYATMWFERPALEHLDEWQDNVMWETDYPHPTAQWPTPSSDAPMPSAAAIEATLGHVSPAVRRKVLHDNAVGVYALDA
jgi:predicted TIM-barrel fold metal-dependent hydrolase